MKTAKLGSISHGTLRTEDLLSAFASTLEDMILLNGEHFAKPENRKERDRLNALHGEALDAWNDDGETLKNKDEADYIADEISDALAQFAPPYCYFGAHMGDGSDFGFWPSIEQIDNLPFEQDRTKGEDYKDVNDHGNVTIYASDGTIVLEIV